MPSQEKEEDEGLRKIEESINAVLDPYQQSHVPLKIKKKKKRFLLPKSRDINLSKVRGKRIVELFRAEPFLMNKRHSRTKEDNEKRSRAYEEIAAQMNKEFRNMEGFKEITSFQAAKLADYWKDRIPDNRNSEEPSLLLTGQYTVSPSPPIFPTPPDSPRDKLEQLQQMTIRRKQTAERLQFIVNTADMFMSKTGLDKQPHGRSAEVNNIRTKVWRRIQEETNIRFNSLKPYNLVQVKKAVSNYKRRKEEAKNIIRNKKYITKHELEEPQNEEKPVMTADPWVAEMDVDNTPIYEDTDDIQTFQDVINYANSVLQDSR
ncbi:Protein CBG09892 [Caenorhabditis briggsae]|uniref:Protein CBG09892 n=2 Tax=Caenorhabditis briggsae TaxID=6238 RepID=A8X9W9_CAEBR|nr:Protein CBG09892 [Caenorhabditis briggsae]ULU01696.1 hypothetical protein L3Y34_001770 [Caenorhabditis briggsae]CAP29434.2 Protein CBG09892 [Caenorhabditis briggsae]